MMKVERMTKPKRPAQRPALAPPYAGRVTNFASLPRSLPVVRIT